MSIIKNITIGSDPEFAAYDSTGTPRSAAGFIPGTKKEPYPLGGGFGIQLDNVGVEATIPITRTREEFVNAMITAKKLAEEQLQRMKPAWHIRAVSSARYDNKELQSKSAMAFGCEPSFCVYTQNVSPRPTPDEVGNLRSFGCHIHIGYETDDDVDVMLQADRLIKAMDITCGLGSLLIDTDADRRSIYGNAGDLRFRQIGNVNIVEYRTLGGAMALDEERLGWVFDQTLLAVNMVNNWKPAYDERSIEIQSTIDNGDVVNAVELMKSFQIKLPVTYDVREFV